MTDHREKVPPTNYVIRVRGSLDAAWLAYWFEGFEVTQKTDRGTTLIGTLADQAALHGLLAKIRDLGLELLFLERIEPPTK
jgi:hypothetical protein